MSTPISSDSNAESVFDQSSANGSVRDDTAALASKIAASDDLSFCPDLSSPSSATTGRDFVANHDPSADFWLDCAWDEYERTFLGSVEAFARRELTETPQSHAERDAQCEFSDHFWSQLASQGVFEWLMPLSCDADPTQYQPSLVTVIAATEILGRECRDLGVLFAMAAQQWGVQHPIVHFGTEEQQAKFLPGLRTGRVHAAHAVTESGSGSDAFAMQTTAKRVDGGYVLQGTKCLITAAPLADLALVAAVTDPDKGRWGTSMFLVPKRHAGVDGFDAGPSMPKMGLRTVPIGELHLRDCFVPDENRLGDEGAGFAIFNHSLEWERAFILAFQVGAMRRQLSEAVKYAREHQRFGQPISKFQSVSSRIVDMRVRLETARLMLANLACKKQNERPTTVESAMLKLHLSECFVESSLDSIRLHGGKGYLASNGIERDLRDGIGGLLYAGTSDVQRQLIAEWMGLG